MRDSAEGQGETGAPTLGDLAQRVWRWRQSTPVLVVGVTGGVASGKSSLTEALVETLRRLPGAPRVERASTDGFLRPNAELEAAGLVNRKGFPETYDAPALAEALERVRQGPTTFPGYSHITYDVDPALARTIDRPDVLIVEGLGLGGATGIDHLIYIDADEADQEAWFVDRFLTFCDVGRRDDASFYARFRGMDDGAAAEFGAMVWRSINRPNLREHIEPLRATADIVVRKRRDHGFESIVAKA